MARPTSPARTRRTRPLSGGWSGNAPFTLASRPSGRRRSRRLRPRASARARPSDRRLWRRFRCKAKGWSAKAPPPPSAPPAQSPQSERAGLAKESFSRASRRPAARRRRPLWRPRRPRARHRRPRRLLPSSMDRRQTHPPASPDRRRKVPPTAAGNPKSQRRHRSPGLRVRLPPPLRSRAARPPTVRPIQLRPACSRRPRQARSARRRRRLSLRGRRSDLPTRRREPRTSRHARARFPLPEQPRLRPSRRSMSIFRLAAWRTPP